MWSTSRRMGTEPPRLSCRTRWLRQDWREAQAVPLQWICGVWASFCWKCSQESNLRKRSSLRNGRWAGVGTLQYAWSISCKLRWYWKSGDSFLHFAGLGDKLRLGRNPSARPLLIKMRLTSLLGAELLNGTEIAFISNSPSILFWMSFFLCLQIMRRDWRSRYFHPSTPCSSAGQQCCNSGSYLFKQLGGVPCHPCLSSERPH